ncbi:MAG TPA: hypothetical protein DCX25_04235 [Candidatus Pacebacteria bacterium]|nr:MAG: hypothetical protein UX00_C0007G0006 [Microgenomates group bacterium GW2011_GWB1_45_17]KKU23520.1 MAG: hypothetical protein UX35_C0005G0022 [Microgenomates group bacterium GW2011_GWA1_46_15]KKU24405.1 MAG: hypothetical protein UX36_C0001G0022 [Microgenomates group bacterium GW2011_GWC1_46_15]HAV15511.1 hypothetical protein [Candidatus Paceibacterota bacterium]HCR10836.1 hypothetical protein [Candidatus Paceibacterota bacterium]
MARTTTIESIQFDQRNQFGQSELFEQPKRQQNNHEVAAHFNLSHVFDYILPNLFKKYEHESPQQRYEKIKFELSAIVGRQLTDALKEILGFPVYDQRYLTIEPQEDGALRLLSPDHGNDDLRDLSARAVEHAANAEYRARFVLEKKQVERVATVIQEFNTICPHALLEYVDGETIPAGLVPYEGALPHDIDLQKHVDETRRPLVGPKHFFVLPQNLDVYPGKTAFWNVWQEVYVPWLPEGKQRVVLIHQYLNRLGHEEQVRALQFAQKDSAVRPTENDIMNTVFTVDSHYQPLGAMEFFGEMIAQLQSHEKFKQLFIEQQTALGQFSELSPVIQSATEYISTVLLEEYARFERLRAHGIIDHTREFVLNRVALDIVMNTFLHKKKTFDTQAALAQYTESFNPENRSAHTTDIQLQKQRNTHLLSLVEKAPSMGNVLSRMYSGLDCTVGSFGGLTRFTEMANSTSFMQGLGLPSMGSAELFTAIKDRGHVFTKDQIAQLIGKERFDQNFKQGTCVACGNTDFVGECGVCWRCELTWEKNSFADDSRTTTGAGEFSDPTATDFFQFGRVGASELIQSTLLPLNRVMSASFSSIS